MPKDTESPTPKRKVPYPSDALGKRSKKTPHEREENQNHSSINNLKRRIRDVKRLLNKADLPADARIVQERALAGYEKELADETRRRERSKMIKKYHFVRFLDRKTATKEVNRLARKQEDLTKAADVDDETKRKKLVALEKRLHVARVNLNYAIYYPLTEKYISIYAEKKKNVSKGQDRDGEDHLEEEDDESSNTNTIIERNAMWRTVEKYMEDGRLDLLREGKLDSNGEVKAKMQTQTQTSGSASKKDTGAKKDVSKEKGERSSVKSGTHERKGNSAKHTPPKQDESEQDESDGGFFEM